MTDLESPDPHEGEIEFTVESLAGRAHQPVRIRVASAWRRMHHLHRPVWLTHRRVGVTALAVALVAAYLLWVAGLAGQWWPRAQQEQQGRPAVLWHFAPSLTQTTIVPASPGTLLPPGDWQSIPLPPTTDRVLSLDFSPTDPQAALACTGPTSDATTLQTKDGPIGLWRTANGGQHWQPLPIPERSGFSCEVQMATGAPQRLLLTIFGSAGCQASHPLLSTDAGQHWRSLAPPLPSLPDKLVSCSLSASVTPRHVFAWVEYSVLASVTTTHTSTGSGTQANYQTSEWTTHSDNDGQTWTAPATTRPPNASLAGNALGGEGPPLTAIDVYVSPGNRSAYGTRFWVSSDLGESWQPQAILPGFAAQWLMAAPGVTLANATARQPLYALSGTEIPWDNFRIQAAQISGHTWALVPPLPVSGTTAEHTGITVALTATAPGKLLVLGLGPHAALPTDSSGDDLLKRTQWLWEWDSAAARWNAIVPLPNVWPSHCTTPCWRGSVSVGADLQGSGAYLWLTDGGAMNEAPTLLRLHLPAGT
jgi:hypothetical protein